MYRATASVQRTHASHLLGSDITAFAIAAPQFPKCLTQTPSVASLQESKCEAQPPELQAARGEWLRRLSAMTKQFGAMMRDPRAPAAAKEEICMHISELLDEAAKLWPPLELTKKWQDVLCEGSAIQRCDPPQRSASGKRPLGAACRLSLRAATAEAMFVVACSLTTFSLLRVVCADTTAAWDEVLTPPGVNEADATPSSGDHAASSGGDGWQPQQAKTGRRRTPYSVGR